MRRLVTKFCDDKKYTLLTLTLLEQASMRKYQNLPKAEMEEMEDLSERDNELEEIETKRLFELQDKQTRNMLQILAVSLSKKHDEYKTPEDGDNSKIITKLMGLLDLRDLQRFIQFAMLGTLPVDEEEKYVNIDEIDISEG